jgi:ADP-ribose pyrophosphatase
MNKKNIINENRTKLSPWVTLLERTIKEDDDDAIYHSFEQHDYVSIVAINDNKEILLVEQYRPAVDKVTLELPGGLLELGETPESCIRKELIEETGYEVGQKILSLGNYYPDTGRLANRFHGFFCSDLRKLEGWSPEVGVNPLLLPIKDFAGYLKNGKLENALHIALIYKALFNQCFNLD